MNITPKPGPNRLLISLVVGAIVLGVVLVLLSRAFGENTTIVAKPAPSFAIRDAQGHVVRLANFKDKALIVCFLATWDKNCQEQMTVLNNLLKGYNETNLVVIGLALDQTTAEMVKAYAEQQHLDYPVYLADYDTIMAFGGLTKIPTMFVIDKYQNVIQQHVGVTETNVLSGEVNAILKQ
jgi:peroxiredoxin